MPLCEGDVGTNIDVTIKEDGTAIDVSTATDISFIFRMPDGTVKTKTGTFKTDGSDGIVRYTTIADDLDQAGAIDLQVQLTLGAWTGCTEIETFQVLDSIGV